MIPFERATRQDLSDPFLLAMLGGLADALTEQGFEMLFSRIGTDELGAAAAPVDSGRAIGIILVGQWGRHEQLNALATRQVPLVVWGAQLPDQLYCCVGSDNVQPPETVASAPAQAGGSAPPRYLKKLEETYAKPAPAWQQHTRCQPLNWPR